MNAAMPLDGDMSTTYTNKDNVKRIKAVMSESKFNGFFPDRHSIYTYDGFLKAASKFDAFCGEDHTYGSKNVAGHKEACKKELATLFAHFKQESNNLEVIREYGCPDTHGHCDYTG
jgi:chitodextrinase